MAPRSHFISTLRSLALAAGVCVFSSAALAQAERPPGIVKTVAGQAYIDFNGQRSPASIGTPVYLRSQLTTGANGSVGITFRDETVMSLGPNSQLAIDQYLFSPGSNQAGLATSLARGTLNYVSGLIAKMRPESVSVTTPTAVIGVRGTQFVVRVEPR
ncbi:MAG: hypothetical protein RLZZ401_1980 [Pseudomonadota bacterium]|jgi:hypothetical protein